MSFMYRLVSPLLSLCVWARERVCVYVDTRSGVQRDRKKAPQHLAVLCQIVSFIGPWECSCQEREI